MDTGSGLVPGRAPTTFGNMRLPLLFIVLLGCGATDESTARESETTSGAEATSDTYGIANAARPFAGIVTAGQPSLDELARARNDGVRTVISLRSEAEDGQDGEQSTAAELGLRFERITMEGADGLTEENARRLAAILDEVSSEGTTLVHCGSSNRVGGLFALKAFYVDGTPLEDAVEIGRRAGLTRLEDAVREHLQSACAALTDDPRC